jgi:hypothetical protein
MATRIEKKRALSCSLAGVAITVAVVVIAELLPVGGVLMLTVLAVSLISAFAGSRLPLVLKVFVTSLIFYWSYRQCLVGRTMEPGLTRSTFGSAAMCFCWMALLPAFALLGLWRPRRGAALVVAVFPVSFAVAAVVAGVEEAQFVRQHRESGAGPTARWTVSWQWLAYDAGSGQLTGAD